MNAATLHSIKGAIIALLGEKLPSYLTYHNTAHTLYVEQVAEAIGKAEGIAEGELLLLQVAALLHDIGFVSGNDSHEETSCQIARQLLSDYHFLPTQIELICGMIMATRIPQSPKTKLEEILADADLEYLGTNGYDVIAEGLYAELVYLKGPITELEWLEIQIQFFETHRYYTEYCLANRQPIKLINLLKLKNRYNALLARGE